ncbi:hypothetical protein CEXT_202101 [Caerostris extrusa]|uniref:Uncharacterized protein n=1 Tax=Caerostris extrusa TaxID=172846 RepID=A0AAV4T5M5_CAEEX|nr:hypothetical protein CEXT_202101 [Caerostris extrusa]
MHTKRQLLLDLKSDGGNSSHCHHPKKQPLPIQRQIRSGKTAASPFTILIRGLDLHTPRCKNSTPKNGFPHQWQHVCPGNCPDVRTSAPRPFQKGYCRTPDFWTKGGLLALLKAAVCKHAHKETDRLLTEATMSIGRIAIFGGGLAYSNTTTANTKEFSILTGKKIQPNR